MKEDEKKKVVLITGASSIGSKLADIVKKSEILDSEKSIYYHKKKHSRGKGKKKKSWESHYKF